MAIFSVDYFSEALRGTSHFRVILPNDAPSYLRENNPNYCRPTKTLILLHGYTSYGGEWVTNAPISQLAMEYNTAVVCPDCGNSFYLDQPQSERYYSRFVGQELIRYVCKTFGLSCDRKDVCAGGFSMGGFGAFHTGFAYPDQFGKILSFSAALIHNEVAGMREGVGNPVASYDYYRTTFGEPSELPESPNNPEFLLRELRKAGKPVPKIFMCIGTEDFLYEKNQQFRRFLREQNVDFQYAECPGTHCYETVNHFLRDAFRFLAED